MTWEHSVEFGSREILEFICVFNAISIAICKRLCRSIIMLTLHLHFEMVEVDISKTSVRKRSQPKNQDRRVPERKRTGAWKGLPFLPIRTNEDNMKKLKLPHFVDSRPLASKVEWTSFLIFLQQSLPTIKSKTDAAAKISDWKRQDWLMIHVCPTAGSSLSPAVWGYPRWSC